MIKQTVLVRSLARLTQDRQQNLDNPKSRQSKIPTTQNPVNPKSRHVLFRQVDYQHFRTKFKIYQN
jgi:hypothetical protein